MATWNETLWLFSVLFVELIALFLVVTFVMELIQRRWLHPSRIQRWLGGQHITIGIVKGVVLGAVTPFCSAIGVPFLLSLLRVGVPFHTALAFLISSPLVDAFILGLIGVLFGWEIVLGYTIIVITVCALAAWLLSSLGMERYVKPGLSQSRAALPNTLPATSTGPPSPPSERDRAEPPPPCSPPAACSAEEAEHGQQRDWYGWPHETRAAWNTTLSSLRDVFWRMLIGIGLGAIIYGLVPQQAMTGVMQHLPTALAVPLAAVAGIPLYMREEAALPIGYALIQSGVGVGLVFAMVIGAAGASLPELSMLSSVFRRPLLLAFVGSVFAVAMAGGWLIPLFVPL
ncbi:permease [Actinopolyspora halophila]|uniref:permease n=1 Tax=Actinopolyspora halophila TaxID=1850 RepID=UPI00035FB388|nr:permease [Actinopolyspora halophila]